MSARVSAQQSASPAAPAIDWLPDEALVATPVLTSIDARIAAWSARWFMRPVRRQEGGTAAAAVTVRPLPRHTWRGFGGGIWLDWNEQTARALALHALGRTELHPKITPDDERLLDKLGERLAEDLATSLTGSPARPSDDNVGLTRAVCLKLGAESRKPGLAVAIDAGLLTHLRKRQCRPWEPARVQARPLMAAVGPVPVTYEVTLGRAAIGLTEFESIEPGDTIVLDQAVAAPIVMRAAATGASIRDTRLVRDDGHLTLTAS